MLLSGCVTVPRELPPPPDLQAAPPSFSPLVRSLGTDPRFTGLEARERIRRLRLAATDGTIDILALSGGGASGAFSAGALTGLGERGERPRYEVVTGVSAGALAAPFAFLGSHWDRHMNDAFTGEHIRHLLRPRGLGALFEPSLSSGRSLRDLVDRFITVELVEEIAREASTGRMLLVATTDLDRQETVLWDMGLIASRKGEPARRLFRDVLIASASVPGLLPPVLIDVEADGRDYQEMHVDGGASTPFFIAPEIIHLAGEELGGLCGANVFILVNGQIEVPARATAVAIIPIINRSFSSLMMHMTRIAIANTNAFARRHLMNFRLAAIPADAAEPDWLDFEPSHMRELHDLGRNRALAGNLWSMTNISPTSAEGAISCSGQAEGPE
ncbi:patatin-like phospholipase family protein [Parasphingopyxis lamellibrachiae]|uniref:patatin-like phospholipase family protein n=1 Tax=Parasphingopyxis lamellibrachiae TaxID=680125 RepID=UPI0013C3084F|nr:patatin-like phospholipase family protein [Parasphingopyxis lamellibrachiae]